MRCSLYSQGVYDSSSDSDELPPGLRREQARLPIYSFNVEAFHRRHQTGTEKEFTFESWEIEKINKGDRKFEAWPITYYQESRHHARVLMMVKPSAHGFKLPQEGESFIMRLHRIKGRREVSHDKLVPKVSSSNGSMVSRDKPVKYLYSEEFARDQATRVDNPCDAWGIENEFWQKCMAFQMKMRMTEVLTLQLALPPQVFKDGFTEIPQSDKGQLGATFKLRLSKSTRDAEINALHSLVEARQQKTPEKKAQVLAFQLLMDFKQTTSLSLFTVFPHLPKDPHNISSGALPQKLIERMKSMDADQVAAWKSKLSDCPNGVCIVPGGPGAGKTFWNLTLAAALQAKVLYLLDINRPLSDVAHRMADLMKNVYGDSEKYRPWTVIHMSCWSYEMTSTRFGLLEAQRKELAHRIELQKQGKQPNEEPGPLSRYDAEADDSRLVQFQGFSRAFQQRLYLGNWHNKQAKPEDQYRALSLNEAAALYYKEHQDTKYADIKRMLHSGSTLSDLTRLRDERIEQLYRDVLQEAQFIATTPVTAHKFSSALFNAKVVMFDEAPHARELSIMIAIANFNPFAWILSGDPRQTKPFVGSYGRRYDVNKYVSQLRVSTMERACYLNPDMPSLLVNHRAHGNLQDLASTLFYDSKMVPAVDPLLPGATPSSVLHLRGKYLMAIKQSEEPGVSRLLVVLNTSTPPVRTETSWYHPAHQDFVMDIVGKLVVDKQFRQTNGKDRGTVLIMSPYRQASIKYNKAIEAMAQTSPGRRLGCIVEARTLDTSQGHEADFVFFDFVNERSTKHLEDPHRLCVALTRARQAEIILMTGSMLTQLGGTLRFPGQRKLAEMVSYCQDKGQFAYVKGKPIFK